MSKSALIDKAEAAADVSADAARNNANSTHKSIIEEEGRFSLSVSLKFIGIAILLSATSAFSAGCIACRFLSELDTPTRLSYIDDIAAAHIYSAENIGGIAEKKSSYHLPTPTIGSGKTVPETTYTSKTFQVEGSSTSHTLHIDRSSAPPTKVAIDLAVPTSSSRDLLVPTVEVGCLDCAASYVDEDALQNASTHATHAAPLLEDKEAAPPPVNDYHHNDDSDGLHLPAGQHLLVDMKGVDSAFLNSEERLATAMVSLINQSKLTLLSYHCHSLVPIGVSCVGVLLESHVSFVTMLI